MYSLLDTLSVYECYNGCVGASRGNYPTYRWYVDKVFAFLLRAHSAAPLIKFCINNSSALAAVQLRINQVLNKADDLALAIQIKIGVACATLPTSSSFCIIFLIRACIPCGPHVKTVEKLWPILNSSAHSAKLTMGNLVLYFFFMMSVCKLVWNATVKNRCVQSGMRCVFNQGWDYCTCYCHCVICTRVALSISKWRQKSLTSGTDRCSV